MKIDRLHLPEPSHTHRSCSTSNNSLWPTRSTATRDLEFDSMQDQFTNYAPDNNDKTERSRIRTNLHRVVLLTQASLSLPNSNNRRSEDKILQTQGLSALKRVTVGGTPGNFGSTQKLVSEIPTS